MTTRTSSGSCLCGGVQFSITLPTKWVAHCHCTRCQRAHGAAFVTWVGVEEGQAAIRDEASLLRWHAADEGGNRGFCGRCGSPMFFRSARYPGELHIARALFLDPVDRSPQINAFYDTHVDWVTVAGDLPCKSDPK